MSGRTAKGPDVPHPSARWRVRSASLSISAVAHLALLAAMLATLSVRTPPRQPPALIVELVPLLEPRAEPRPRPKPPPPVTPSTAAANAPSPAPAAQPAVGTTAGPRPTSGGVAGDLGQARAVLRGALGCAHPELVKLSDAERAACAKKLASGINPNVAWPANIAPEKRAWFDASVAAHNSPGRLPGFGCVVGFDGLKLILPKKKPSHSLKLGPLPCFIVPPSGPLDDDVDVPPPSRNGPSYEGSPLKPPPPLPDFTGGGGPSY